MSEPPTRTAPTPTEVERGDQTPPLTPTGRKLARVVGLLVLLALLTALVFSTLAVSEGLLVMGIVTTLVGTWAATFLGASRPRDINERTH